MTSNETITPVQGSAPIDKATLAARIRKSGQQLLEDYVLWRKCGWSDQEFGALLGISAKSVSNRYLAEARKKGLIEAGKCGQAAAAYGAKDAQDWASPVENSEPARAEPEPEPEPQASADLTSFAFQPTSQAYSHELAPLLEQLQLTIHHHRTNDNCSAAEISAIIQGLFICHRDALLWEKAKLRADGGDHLASAAVDDLA